MILEYTPDGETGGHFQYFFESPLVCQHALNTGNDGRANKCNRPTRDSIQYHLNFGKPDLLAKSSGVLFFFVKPTPAKS